MAIELPYFKFYTAEYDSGDISICSFEAQGLFTAICSLYWSRQGKVTLANAKKRFQLASDQAWIELLDEKIIKVVDGKLVINFLDEQFFQRGRSAKSNADNIKKRWIDKNGQLKPETKKKYESNTDRVPNPFNIEERRGEERREEVVDSLPVLDSSPVITKVVDVDSIDIRIQSFKETVYEQGSTTFTRVMLDDFISYWIEPTVNRKKTKLRYELEKTWDLKRRFNTWASKSKQYACFLTDEQKTIEVKKTHFATSIKPFLEKYGRTVLNEFYAYWSQPENKADPKFLRYELEEFWDPGQRLASWKSREQEISQKATGYTMPRSFVQQTAK